MPRVWRKDDTVASFMKRYWDEQPYSNKRYWRFARAVLLGAAIGLSVRLLYYLFR